MLIFSIKGHFSLVFSFVTEILKLFLDNSETYCLTCKYKGCFVLITKNKKLNRLENFQCHYFL